MPKTRQVGKSGLKVSPKVYLALGISGAPEHIKGMKSAGLVAGRCGVCEGLSGALGDR